MDFDKLFNNAPKGNSTPNANMSLVEELLNSAKDSYKQTAEITEEDAINAFNRKYGGGEEFIMKHFQQMIEPYEEVTLDAIHNYVKSLGEPQSGPIVAAGIVDVARHFATKILDDNCSGGELDTSLLKAAMAGHAVSKILPSDSPKDSMIMIVGLLGVVSFKLAELTMSMEANRLVREEFGQS